MTIEEPTLSPIRHDHPDVPKAMDEPLDVDEIVSLTEMMFGHLDGQISLAEFKAQIAVAVDAVFLALAVTIDRSILVSLLTPDASLAHRLVSALSIAMIVALLVSVYGALRVARPTLTVMTPPNPFYFVNIHHWSKPEFVKAFTGQTRAEMKNNLMDEVYTLSGIAHRKFSRVRVALNLLIVAIALWALIQFILLVAQ
ncbi:MAG: DUF5706 domain-containing protein [Anaerolineae bacterium]